MYRILLTINYSFSEGIKNGAKNRLNFLTCCNYIYLLLTLNFPLLDRHFRMLWPHLAYDDSPVVTIVIIILMKKKGLQQSP